MLFYEWSLFFTKLTFLQKEQKSNYKQKTVFSSYVQWSFECWKVCNYMHSASLLYLLWNLDTNFQAIWEKVSFFFANPFNIKLRTYLFIWKCQNAMISMYVNHHEFEFQLTTNLMCFIYYESHSSLLLPTKNQFL